LLYRTIFRFYSRELFADSLKIRAQSAVLKNLQTGEILLSKNADRGIPPASITKVLTLYLAFEAIEEDKAGLTTRRDQPEGEPDEGVTDVRRRREEVQLDDLIKGTAIVPAMTPQ